MRQLTEKQLEEFNEVIDKAMFGVVYSKLNFADNPFVFRVEIMGDCGEAFALEKCNALFHELGLLDMSRNLGLGDLDTYCELSRYSISGKECYVATFNHPKALNIKLGTCDEPLILSRQRRFMYSDAEYKAQIMQMIKDLNAGKFRAKVSEGRFVMEDDRYDKVESGKEDKEWLLLSRGQLKRAIGIKTVRLYKDDGTLKPKTSMRWEVASVTLENADGDECDATSVPPDFWPENIVIHLGKRLQD